jgi:Zn-dependent protease
MIDLLFSDPARFVVQLLFLIPAFLVAVTVHELAHGVVADRLGDPTARVQGRLTLNPLPHIDPLGAVAFLLAGFGWAKPVPVNAYNLRHPRRDMAWIAAAGPLSNFAVAFVGLVGVVLIQRIGMGTFVAEPLGGVLFAVFRFNLALGIFNLIPLPPLDGGHFLPYFLPRASWTTLHQLEQYGPMILLLLVMTGATRYVVGPVMNVVSGIYFSLVQMILAT